MRPVRWVGLKDPNSDIYTKRGVGYDVMNGVDGWGVLAMSIRARWAFDGERWIEGTSAAPPRGKPGAATRDDARKFAESLIAQRGE